MQGQFLVARPADGVAGETPAIYPNASDYHLLCLQARRPAQAAPRLSTRKDLALAAVM